MSQDSTARHTGNCGSRNNHQWVITADIKLLILGVLVELVKGYKSIRSPRSDQSPYFYPAHIAGL